ncbi:MAG: hypothetical protein Q9209_003732 [Squamulea sp. 1 TL-2023]
MKRLLRPESIILSQLLDHNILQPSSGPSPKSLGNIMNTFSKISNRLEPKDPGLFMGLLDEVVAVFVGSDEVPFNIHKGLLCSKSTNFKAAFEGSFEGVMIKKLYLADEDPEIFGHYVMWVYNQDLKFPDIWNESVLSNLCHLYVLADKLGSEVLQNIVIDKILGYYLSETKDDDPKGGDSHLSYWHMSPTTLRYVYDATPPGSVLRSILVDILVWQVDFCMNPGLADAPPEFLYEALKVCETHLPLFPGKDDDVAPYFENKAVCKKYHTHKSSKECEHLEESKE